MSKIPTIAMIPSGYKANKLYSVLPTNGDADLAFTRTGAPPSFNATRVNELGLIEEVLSDVPRLDYSDGGCPSLLLEPASTNLITHSEPTAIDNASNDVTYEAFTWANGFTNCVRYSGASNQYHYTGQSSATIHTLSFYVIMDDLSEPKVGLAVTDDFRIVIGNLQDGSETIKKKDLGNGLWRIKATNTPTTGTFFNNGVRTLSNSGKGFRIVGLQLEQKSYATSYIPTTGTTATRVAETVSKTGLSSYINSSEGVLYFEIKALSNNSGSNKITFSDGSNDNSLELDLTGNNFITFVSKVSGTQAYLETNSYSINEFNKIAVKYKENDFSLWVNGVEVDTDVSGTTSLEGVISILRFSNNFGTTDFFKGNCKDLRVYNQVLTDAELIALTS